METRRQMELYAMMMQLAIALVCFFSTAAVTIVSSHHAIRVTHQWGAFFDIAHPLKS